MSGRHWSIGRPSSPVVAWFHEVDERFSLFRPDSEASRVAAGELGPRRRQPGAPRDRRRSPTRLRIGPDGFFDARRHLIDGRLDPTGIVKGWSVDEAVALPAPRRGPQRPGRRGRRPRRGRDRPSPGAPWRIGIRHPTSRCKRRGGARRSRTSRWRPPGLYERGGHIRDPHTGRVPAELLSMTVVGPTLALADAYATAAFAMGERGIAWVARQPGFGGLGDHAGPDAWSGRRWSTRSSPGRGDRPPDDGRLSRQSQAPGVDWRSIDPHRPAGAHP